MPIPSMSNLYYKEEEKGKVIHSSKIHYHWGFTVFDVNHTIELIDSRLSTKKQILINGKVLYKGEGQEDIAKTFDLAEHTFVLIPYGNRYELRVDGNPFKHLIMAETNKKVYNSTKNLQNWQIGEPEEKYLPQRAQSNLKINRLFSFDIKPKEDLQTRNDQFDYFNIKMANDKVDKKENEVNLLDLEFSHPQPVYHPYSSNNVNFDYSDRNANVNQYNLYNNHNNNNSNQVASQFTSNSNSGDYYEINQKQKRQTMIDFFD